MTPEESIALIKANLQEVLNGEIIDDVILNQKRHLKVYWGSATTGKCFRLFGGSLTRDNLLSI